MAEIFAMRGPHGILVPADDESASIIEQLPMGQGVRLLVSRVRDIVRHRRFFKMVGVGFDAWEPPPLEYGGMPAVKNRETFRKELIKAAGFYTVVADIEGNVRLEPHSIAFANMDQDAFEPVYRGVRAVLLEKVLTSYTSEDLDRVVNELMRF